MITQKIMYETSEGLPFTIHKVKSEGDEQLRDLIYEGLSKLKGSYAVLLDATESEQTAETYHRMLVNDLCGYGEGGAIVPEKDIGFFLDRAQGSRPIVKKLYRDFSDYYSEGSHYMGNASRDILRATWDDLLPTIEARRGDWENYYIEKSKDVEDRHRDFSLAIRAYLEEFDLEKKAGVKFFRWWLDKQAGRPDSRDDSKLFKHFDGNCTVCDGEISRSLEHCCEQADCNCKGLPKQEPLCLICEVKVRKYREKLEAQV